MGMNKISNLTQKCVLIIDNAQSTGIIANVASVLSISLGKNIDGIVSHDVYDKEGGKHLGITQLPVPVLGASRGEIKEIRQHLLSLSLADMVLVDFLTIAQQSRTYEEYEASILNAEERDIHYVGIGVCGEKKIINKATGNLRLI
jgi:hypothetical protein